MCRLAQQQIKSIHYALLGSYVLVCWSFIISTSVHACFMSVHLCVSLWAAWAAWNIIWMASCWPDELKGAASQLEQQPQRQITFTKKVSYSALFLSPQPTFWPRFNCWQSLLFMAIIVSQCVKLASMCERDDKSAYIWMIELNLYKCSY